MTYCLGILLKTGLVLASDSRSNAGIDQITRVRKLTILIAEHGRMIAILGAGNLATTQAVITTLMEAVGSSNPIRDVATARTMFEVAGIVGTTLRDIVAGDGKYVAPYGDPTASFIVGGQITGETHRLFEVYAAGNHVEASDRACFLQIGETKYGKPILDRVLAWDDHIDEAGKLALLSFDATIRSNLSVGLPIDILRYDTGSYSASGLVTLEEQNAYWRELRNDYANGLAALVATLPPLPPAESLKP